MRVSKTIFFRNVTFYKCNNELFFCMTQFAPRAMRDLTRNKDIFFELSSSLFLYYVVGGDIFAASGTSLWTGVLAEHGCQLKTPPISRELIMGGLISVQTTRLGEKEQSEL